MNLDCAIPQWLADDTTRIQALQAAATLNLPDWCLAGGVVRNLVWDQLHGYPAATALADIDLVYFDPVDITAARDNQLEAQLKALTAANWSVKNQARMHLRNHDTPYSSTADAMRHWVEVETAIGVRLTGHGDIQLVAPFGLDSLAKLTITLNPLRRKPDDMRARIRVKRWLEIWPQLRVVGLD